MLEVAYTGRYSQIDWRKNSSLIRSSASNKFINFLEIFYVESTTTAEIGTYEISGEKADSQQTTFVNTVQLVVVQYGMMD